MNRKNFIKLSALSLAALIFERGYSIGSESNQLISFPDNVLIRTIDGWIKLERYQSGIYTYKDTTIYLQHAGGSLEIFVTAPSVLLEGIRLHWKHFGTDKSILLGDHWERTYGDVSFKPFDINKKMPWYFLQSDNTKTICFGVKTGCKSICYWNADQNNLQLTLDTKSGGSGIKLGTRRLNAASIVVLKNREGENSFKTGKRFCKLMCNTPRLPSQPVYGINDWYFAYGNNSADLILEHTRLITDLATNNNNRPFSIIDAGWAAYSPNLPNDCCWHDDFSRSNNKFPDMHLLAEEIVKLGMRPGLWMRPLAASYKDPQNLLLPSIPGRTDPKNPILDPTIESNLERVAKNISLYKEWGYHLVKHDYSSFDIFGRWGFEMNNDLTAMGWKMNDNTKTNAEIILLLYNTIRRSAKDMYLIGCNTLSHLSAGIFELNRIGDDTSGKDWDRTKKMGVNTLGFRMIQHKSFYEADGDCVGLTKDVDWSKNKQWMNLITKTGTPLFISAQKEALGEEQRKYIKECFSTTSNEQIVAEPLDWKETSLPKRWVFNNKIQEYYW